MTGLTEREEILMDHAHEFHKAGLGEINKLAQVCKTRSEVAFVADTVYRLLTQRLSFLAGRRPIKPAVKKKKYPAAGNDLVW